jgi:hypothetical protein
MVHAQLTDVLQGNNVWSGQVSMPVTLASVDTHAPSGPRADCTIPQHQRYYLGTSQGSLWTAWSILHHTNGGYVPPPCCANAKRSDRVSSLEQQLPWSSGSFTRSPSRYDTGSRPNPISQRWPKIGPVHVQTIMLPIIYQGSSQLSVGVNSPVLSGVIVGIVSQFWLRRRHPVCCTAS